MMNIHKLLDLGANTVIIDEETTPPGGLRAFFKLGINPIPLKDVIVWDAGDVKLISKNSVMNSLNNLRDLETEVDPAYVEDIIREYRRNRL